MSSFEYRARITMSSNMAGNGNDFCKRFNGTCTVGLKNNSKGNNSIAKRAEAYLQAVSESNQTPAKVSAQPANRATLPRLESVSRIGAIPIVGTGIGVGEKIYYKIRESNPLIRWSLSTAESSVMAGVSYALPAVGLLERPLSTLDRLLCRSLDVVEQRVPAVYLPPETMYTNTRRYVMRRADSVKQLGSAVLDSRVTAATAGALDRALATADRYVDRYLPPDQQDVADGPGQSEGADGGGGGEGTGRVRAAQTMQHGARLRRKLQRRLTRQALAEAKAIKEQIHVIAYIAELVATDPVLAWRKACALYESLSRPEPENQARPDTLEELAVLLAREAARRVVHLINYTASDLPRSVKSGVDAATGHVAAAAEALLKTSRLETATGTAACELRGLRNRLEALLQDLRTLSNTYLEHLAVFLAGGGGSAGGAGGVALGTLPPASPDSGNALNGIN